MDETRLTMEENKCCGSGKNIVLTSRIRLARNIKGQMFPGKIDSGKGFEIIESIKNGVTNCRELDPYGLEYMEVSAMGAEERADLLSGHLVSRELLQNTETGGVFLGKERKVSLLVNEEDHLRIQILLPGNNLEKAWKEADFIDDCLEESLDFVFDRKYGYLTACPSNVGTGLRASSMMHLPALVFTKYIKRVFDISNSIGLTVRGLFGEGTKAEGDMFQISNQITCGKTEDEIIRDLGKITAHVVAKEMQAREHIMNGDRIKTEDKIYRAMGILANSRILSRAEGMKLLSLVRLGTDLGIVEDIDIETIDALMRGIQHLENDENMKLAVERAEQVRMVFR